MACLPAAALLTRADREDAEYLELATRYAASVRLPASAGEGVLVGPRWVLTAAAPAELLREVKPPPAIAISGREYQIDAIHANGEIALLHLDRPVADVAPIPLHRGAERAGSMLAIAAHGATGKLGGRPAGPPDGKRRAGINTIAVVADRTFEAHVKPNEEASDLQGGLTTGERGAGAYVSGDDDRLYLAGIALSTDGGRETYARLSLHLKWIEDTMRAAAKREAE